MNRILIIVFLFIGFSANSQIYYRDNQYIYKNKLGVGYQTLTNNPVDAWFVIGDSATNKAMIIPRVADTSTIVNPRMGMMIYRIADHSVYVRTLTAWVSVGASGKLNISDTASMLANYLRGSTEGYGIDISGTQHKTWTLDSATVFPHIRATISSGSGTINSGTTGKPAYYTGSTTLDDFIAVDYATSGTNMLLTTQNTTDVGLNIKGVSSQSANLLNISSSAGTGDLASITKDGYLTAARLTASNISATHVLYAGTAGLLQGTSDFAYAPTGVNMLTVTGSNAARSSIIVQNLNSNGNASSYWQNNRGSLSTYAGFLVGGSTDAGSNLFGLTRADRTFLIADGATNTGLAIGTLTADDLVLGTNNAERLRILSGGGVIMPEMSAPSTPTSGYVAIYPKSDGLWYGKDDAGVETKLSNGSFQKGAFLESPTSADTLDVWQTPVAITITSLKAILRGTSPSVTYNIGFGTNIQSPTAVFTADITCTSITTGCSNSSGFNDATIPAGSFIWIYTNAASGTIRSISFTINYTED